jgi:hypothetical protein
MLGVFLCVTALAAGASDERLMVLPFGGEPGKTDLETVRQAEQLFREAAQRLAPQRVLSHEETLEDLQTAQEVDRKLQSARGAELVPLLPPMFSSRRIITGDAVGNVPSLELTVRVFDGGTRAQQREMLVMVSSRGGSLAGAMERAVTAILGLETHGSLQVTCAVAGKLFVDGQEVESCPVELRFPAMEPKPHVISVRMAGAQAERMVDVRAGYVTLVDVNLRGGQLGVEPRDSVSPLPGAADVREKLMMPLEKEAHDPAGAPGARPAATRSPLRTVLLGGAIGAAVLGAALAVLGISGALVGGGATALWPRTTPVTGAPLRFEMESQGLAQARVVLGLLLVPVGFVVFLVGGVTAVAGAGAAGFIFVRRE